MWVFRPTAFLPKQPSHFYEGLAVTGLTDFMLINFHVMKMVLSGCETWCWTLREEHRLRVFDNRVLRRIFGPKKDEVTVGWKPLLN
jgi:hypothetical protein